jgi:hypothetical protein
LTLAEKRLCISSFLNSEAGVEQMRKSHFSYLFNSFQKKWGYALVFLYNRLSKVVLSFTVNFCKIKNWKGEKIFFRRIKYIEQQTTPKSPPKIFFSYLPTKVAFFCLFLAGFQIKFY